MTGLIDIAMRFTEKRVVDVQDFGSGNINNTFLVTLDSEGDRHFILQRINTRVFLRPDLVMGNMRIASEHMRERLLQAPLPEGRRWEVPAVLLTREGEALWSDADESVWRALTFIGNAQTFDILETLDQAREVGYALGMFHTLLSDLHPTRLADTLEGFHITPQYLRHYDAVLAKYSGQRSMEAGLCIRHVERRRGLVPVLEDARARGELLQRAIHGDPKVNNIMMDRSTGLAVGMVDLDTVKPGLIHYDIGDCLRSGCNPLGEETKEWKQVRFDLDLCRALLQGYLSTSREFLTAHDFDYLYDSIRLIAFELGLRFFTDYLEGNVYFRVRGPEHNLARALVQFRLTESIEVQEKGLREIIGALRE